MAYNSVIHRAFLIPLSEEVVKKELLTINSIEIPKSEKSMATTKLVKPLKILAKLNINVAKLKQEL